MDKHVTASDMGKKSAKKRHEGKSPEEIKEYYRQLRLKRKDLASNTP